MARIELTRDAERDLIDIYLYGIEHFGHAQAEDYAGMLSAKIAIAARNVSFGADYGFVRNRLRRYECASHAITTSRQPRESLCYASCMAAWTQAAS